MDYCDYEKCGHSDQSKNKTCENCLNHMSEMCLHCSDFYYYEAGNYVCPICGGHVEEGSAFIPSHCENTNCPMGLEATVAYYG